MMEEIQGYVQTDEVEKIEIQMLLEAIYSFYGHDFRDYAPSFIGRRIMNRVRKENLESISELQGKILRDPVVMKKLYYDFSINVTEMFRDPAFFKSFRDKVVPVIREYP